MTTTKRATKKQTANKVKSEDVAPYNAIAPKHTRAFDEEESILEQAREISRRRLQRLSFAGSPDKALTCLKGVITGLQHEVFGIVYLDQQHYVIGNEELFRGTIDGAAVYPREVVKSVLQKNAAAVILYHNHPSGKVDPSLADRQITRRLVDALSLVDVRVLDHFVLCANDSFSFAENNLL